MDPSASPRTRTRSLRTSRPWPSSPLRASGTSCTANPITSTVTEASRCTAATDAFSRTPFGTTGEATRTRNTRTEDGISAPGSTPCVGRIRGDRRCPWTPRTRARAVSSRVACTCSTRDGRAAATATALRVPDSGHKTAKTRISSTRRVIKWTLTTDRSATRRRTVSSFGATATARRRRRRTGRGRSRVTRRFTTPRPAAATSCS
mmetsp:Transcript_12248/g.44057  ORF Transcript_12248/g.44057 Transcript_12248/m.44057 type:complete len:205 (-) Transcript_12248:937-1551(-)